ncbi:apolipoprotein N-acyltransferase [Roseibium sp. RKSG952]|uniref:apolipoprotein N-acyltransferase n=1 Tax=Roseibium sp. RKSG952 TaxID=2529384 RepID=UPI001AD91DC8|nr:apolipoprotein N-acyltransferase [Roseibium sp. RKSG952]
MALLSGAVAALSLPPLDWSVVLLLAFPALVWLIDGSGEPGGTNSGKLRNGFFIGWLFGFGYFLAGLWWIGSAFLVEADRFAWMIPFAILTMPMGLALFTGVATAIAARFWKPRASRVLLLAVCLSASDWLRGHVLTGFPWNAFGYGISGSLSLSQLASVVGLYGLSFLVVAVAAAPAVLADKRTKSARVLTVAIAVAVFVTGGVYGVNRLTKHDGGDTATQIRIIQPSIDQSEKWKPENRARIFQDYLELTRQPFSVTGSQKRDRIVIWPESAVPFLLLREPGALAAIGEALPQNASLITGAVRTAETADGPVYFNSIFVIGSNGVVQDIYDKVRLVPFGEYLPLENILSSLGVTALVDVPSAFRAGAEQRPLKVMEGGSVLPLICYEAIFPGLSRNASGQDYSWILNVTNDAWFGRTPGPYQHFAQARLRAIEQGVPLIRAANTGISAVVDPKGRILESLPLFQRGVIDAPLPSKLSSTLYGRYGEITFALLLGLSLFFFICQPCNHFSRKD